MGGEVPRAKSQLSGFTEFIQLHPCWFVVGEELELRRLLTDGDPSPSSVLLAWLKSERLVHNKALTSDSQGRRPVSSEQFSQQRHDN